MSCGSFNWASLCGGHPAQSLPSHFGLLLKEINAFASLTHGQENMQTDGATIPFKTKLLKSSIACLMNDPASSDY